MNNNILELLTYKFFIDCGFFVTLFLILSIALKISCKILSRPSLAHKAINYDLLKETAKPIYLLISILFFIKISGNIADIINSNENLRIFFIEKIPTIQSIIIIIFFTISGYIFIKSLKANYINISKNADKKIDLHVIDLFSKIALLALFSMSSLAIMQKIGVGFGAIATLGGMSGIVIGFATKDFFGNIVGLISIYLDKPFILNDQISIFSGSSIIANGVVEEIGIRMTLIRTIPNRTALYIPNSIFTTNIVENKSRRSNRFFEKKLKIHFANDMEKINNILIILREKIHACEFVDHESSNTFLEITDIDEQFLSLKIMTFFLKMDLETFTTKSNILMSIIFDEFRKNNLRVISKDAWVTFEEKEVS